MPQHPPIKNTSGEGFSVEDLAVTYIAAHMLAGVPWVGSGRSSVEGIQCQAMQDGWFFDDIILGLRHADGTCNCGCSIKSFTVLGKRGAPKELAESIWKEWRNTSSTGFQCENDSLTLFAAQHSPEIREAWIGLCDSARALPAETLADRMVREAEPSKMRRDAFASLQPEGDRKLEDDAHKIAKILAKFRLAEHDFQHSESQSVNQAILLCQQALADAARNQASALWEALVSYCASVRRKGGHITLASLLTELAPRFLLKQHPRYAADWSKILCESRQRLAALPAKIGGQVSVERKDLLDVIADKAGKQSTVVLLGGSGNGKSVLAHDWAGTEDTAWFRAADLGTPGGLRALFSLEHSVPDLLANVSRPSRLVLDGLDKCFEEGAFDEAALLLRAAASTENRDRWQTAITCCPEDWERVRGQLIRRSVVLPNEPVVIGRFSEAELRSVCEQVPSLRPLAHRSHLNAILRWPKALDIFATYSQTSEVSFAWVTESDFARWFWRSAICHNELGSARDRLMRKVAVDLADRMAASAPLDNFSADETEVLAEIAHDGHLEIDSTRRTVRFTHELIGDWARQRELQVQGEADGAFLRARMHSPLWHRATRFHGLDLLESNSDAEAWLRLFLVFESNSPNDEMAQNLLLEAPVFALTQRAVLERLWPVLEADDGELLRRFLRQFLRIATIPDDEMVARFQSRGPDLQLEVAALYRLPWVPYWRGVVKFLGAHSEKVIEFAPEEIADVCLLWLPLHGLLTSGMKEAAQLAVDSARRLYRSGERWHGSHRRHRDVSPEEKICQALLAAAPEMPIEVTELALKLSGRRHPDAEDNLPKDDERPRSRSLTHPYGPLNSWPEGPQCHGAEVFRKAFMSGNHAAPFIRALPEVAAQVMFAVLLSLPREGWHPRDFASELDEHGFQRGDLRFQSPLWISGPFLNFLRINPAVALPAIIRLVNFATDRAYELGEDVRQHVEVPVTVDRQTHLWRGHQFSYLWPQGHVFGPDAVGCALLSLEKWFYLLQDENEPIEQHVATILRDSRSIALAAVLISVGKRQPDLFLGPLRPMLAAIDFFWIEEYLHNRAEGGYRTSSFYERSEAIVAVWREWVQMPHRKEAFGSLALRKFLSDPKWREAIAELRQVWQARIEAATPENPAPAWLPRIASQFDLQNWHTEQRENDVLIAYDPPSSLPRPTPEEMERFNRLQLLTLLPFQCRQVLMGEAECSEKQMTEWWSQLEYVRSLSPDEDERGFRDVEDALCGIVAVAVVKHRRWLAANPAREKEALSILEAVGRQPPKQFWHVEDDTTDFKWDSFAAWALTTLWCEQPDDPYLLQAVGALVLWDRNLVVSRVMTIAAQHREKLGAHFDRLLAHTIRYAPARHRARMERHLPEKTFDRDAWVSAHLEKFVSGKTEPLPQNWTELLESNRRRRRPHVNRGSDIGHMCAALDWAEDLSTACDAGERQRWLNYHRQILLCTLTRIEELIRSQAPPEPFYDVQQYWPYNDERRMLERVARIVARLAPGENHQALWEPIFALGCPGERWVDAFIGHWLIYAAGDEEPSPSFPEQWLAMLTYAESSPTWKLRSRSSSASRDLWHELLGFSVYSGDFWNEKLAPAVEAAREFHERWARAHVSDDDDARSFVGFLMTPAARRLRVDGLRLLHEKVPIDDRYFWNEDSIRDAIARFLRLLQHDHWNEIARDSGARDAFMAFALKLGALQHPLGSEVLTLAGSRLGQEAKA
jgi:hypothetical protein